MNPALVIPGILLAALIAWGVEELMVRRQIRQAKRHARRRGGYVDTPTGGRRLP